VKAFAITGAVMANEEGERNMGSRAGHWGAGSSGPKAQKRQYRLRRDLL